MTRLTGQSAMSRSVNPQVRLRRILQAQLGRQHVHEIAVSVLDAGSGAVEHAAAGAYGKLSIDEQTPYFLASTTKLFATTLVMQLRSEGVLRLDDPITGLFGDGALAALHRVAGRDHTGAITIQHLLAHTSGLPDYFDQKRKDGTRFAGPLLGGEDRQWSLGDVISASRDEMRPHFPPGEDRKAFYSDTNYQLLGGIIERVTGKSLADNVEERIARPLGLKNTYLCASDMAPDRTPVLPLRNGRARPHIPRAIESTRLDGGGVSTSAESLAFIRAFFEGGLFPAGYLAEMEDWRSIFFPLQCGVGVLRFELPWFFSPFKRQPVLIGHSGISGAFAYYCPERRIYLAGTVNQLASRSLPYRFMLSILSAL